MYLSGGPGLERGMEGEPAEFNVWTREAGPGSLAISVEGPSKAHIDFKDRKDGSCYVSYIVEVREWIRLKLFPHIYDQKLKQTFLKKK